MSFALRRKQVPRDLARCSFRRTDGVLMTCQGSELVLLDVRSERYYTMNDVGAVAWSTLAEPRTCAAIVDAIRREFDASAVPDHDIVERDVEQLLEQLLAAGLVSVESELVGATP